MTPSSSPISHVFSQFIYDRQIISKWVSFTWILLHRRNSLYFTLSIHIISVIHSHSNPESQYGTHALSSSSPHSLIEILQVMATQTMLLTVNVSSHVNGGAGEPLITMLKPKSLSDFSRNARSAPSSSPMQIVAVFKAKTKAPAVKKAPASGKLLVEDGIFGTSGGIGFTKQNELFVGRVAMLGFAASLLGEAITGKGILAQLNLETGIPIYEAEPLLLFFILFNLLGAIGALGDRGRFVDDTTGLDKAVIAPGKGVRNALGLGEGGPLFGFTKANELFVGRLAQLGIAFSIIGEIITGKGALAQLNIETGVPITEIEPLILFNVAFFFFAAINPGTGKFLTDEEAD